MSCLGSLPRLSGPWVNWLQDPCRSVWNLSGWPSVKYLVSNVEENHTQEKITKRKQKITKRNNKNIQEKGVVRALQRVYDAVRKLCLFPKCS